MPDVPGRSVPGGFRPGGCRSSGAVSPALSTTGSGRVKTRSARTTIRSGRVKGARPATRQSSRVSSGWASGRALAFLVPAWMAAGAARRRCGHGGGVPR